MYEYYFLSFFQEPSKFKVTTSVIRSGRIFAPFGRSDKIILMWNKSRGNYSVYVIPMPKEYTYLLTYLPTYVSDQAKFKERSQIRLTGRPPVRIGFLGLRNDGSGRGSNLSRASVSRLSVHPSIHSSEESKTDTTPPAAPVLPGSPSIRVSPPAPARLVGSGKEAQSFTDMTRERGVQLRMQRYRTNRSGLVTATGQSYGSYGHLDFTLPIEPGSR